MADSKIRIGLDIDKKKFDLKIKEIKETLKELFIDDGSEDSLLDRFENGEELKIDELKQVYADISKELRDVIEKKSGTVDPELEKEAERLRDLKQQIAEAIAKANEEEQEALRLQQQLNEENKKKKPPLDFAPLDIDKMIKKLTKYGTALLGVRGAFGLLRKGVSAYMSANEEMAKQLQGIWGALGEAMSPAIEAVINMIMKGIAYINAFVKALTGIDFVARANAKSLAKQNKATQAQLASFDEMNKLSDSAGGASVLNLPELNDKEKEFFTFIEEHANIINAVLKGLATTIGVLLAFKLVKSLGGLSGMLGGIHKVITLIFTTLSTSTFAWIVAIIAGIIVVIDQLYKNCEPFRVWVDNFKAKLEEFFGKAKDWLKENGGNWQAWVDLITGFFDDITKKLKELGWEGIMKAIGKGILTVFIGIVNKVIDALNWLIRQFNKLSFTVPDWVAGIGGKTFGVNLKMIQGNYAVPELAKGGIAVAPTRAIIGEAGKEAVLPLENNTEWLDMLAERLSGTGETTIIVQLDGKTISKEIRKANAKYQFATNGGTY